MRLIAFFVTTLIAWPIATESGSEPRALFVVWNVGQGLWTTWVDSDLCLHLDMGGERAPWPAIRRLCGHRRNLIALSHWDLDHISFTARAAREMKNSCVLMPPAGDGNPRKERLFAHLRPCEESDLASLPRLRDLSIPRDQDPAGSKRGSNDESRVFLLRDEILVPGDSSQKEERLWSRESSLSKVRILVLGHHGSRTSTSEQLVNRLPSVRVAIASSRKNKYGHPHQEVADRLKRHHIPLLSTEPWGTLKFELSEHPLRATASPEAMRSQTARTRITDDRAYIPCSSCERRVRRSHGRHTRSDL